MVNSKNCRTFVVGEMAEWSIAAVLKTVELRGSGGSNPSLSADDQSNSELQQMLKFFCIKGFAKRATQDHHLTYTHFHTPNRATHPSNLFFHSPDFVIIFHFAIFALRVGVGAARNLSEKTEKKKTKAALRGGYIIKPQTHTFIYKGETKHKPK